MNPDEVVEKAVEIFGLNHYKACCEDLSGRPDEDTECVCPIGKFRNYLSGVLAPSSCKHCGADDWDIEAIDHVKDRVVFKRYQRQEEL